MKVQGHSGSISMQLEKRRGDSSQQIGSGKLEQCTLRFFCAPSAVSGAASLVMRPVAASCLSQAGPDLALGVLHVAIIARVEQPPLFLTHFFHNASRG